MLAFIKRRWILLSCAVVLLACSMITFLGRFDGEYLYAEYGLGDGELRLDTVSGSDYPDPIPEPLTPRGAPLAIKRPSVGLDKSLALDAGDVTSYVRVPLWIPLFVVLGWIVLRELRWRAKRARKAE